MKKYVFLLITFICASCSDFILEERTEIQLDDATLVLTPLAQNAVRVQLIKDKDFQLPDEWIYQNVGEKPASDVRLKVTTDGGEVKVRFMDKKGHFITEVLAHDLIPNNSGGIDAYQAKIQISSPANEYLTGLGQFQDGLGNLRGVTRRLTQVNTQISIPMLLSNKGYGLLWNNYGLVDFNPSSLQYQMERVGEDGKTEVVDVTSTEGGKKEVRRSNFFRVKIPVEETGKYAIMLDVGQSMARRHNLCLDGETIIDVRNTWLPPTTSVVVDLTKGMHTFTAELTNGDNPVLHYRMVDDLTTFSSPVADKVDYTLFVGTPDEVIASYRKLTGEVPMMPKWALGYIHCRERYHSSEEILQNARTFREKELPVDVIVQDWQWWGKYGWNSMKFDEDFYPDPSALTAELHDSLNMRLMLSVWSKVDDNSELGQQMKEQNFYIPGTTWIDFFNPKAADFYWKNFRDNLLVHNIDAWWQDATEPENDDLAGRMVASGKIRGEQVRNTYPLLVSKTVYEGLRKDDPQHRAMILTRSGFPGIQRYGSTLWSGDVGNDWETLRRQITGGLGLMATGHPWWTYDAGGFFRPWGNQYEDKDYIERMLRWIETATFLPLMRVHGYMTETEPWRYGEEAEDIIREQLELRYRLLPYIYSEAAKVSREGYTLMRPLIFDYGFDSESLKYDTEFMFGGDLLVNPILKPDVKYYETYLPPHAGGWYDVLDNEFFEGGQTIEKAVSKRNIPVFVEGGSIFPVGPIKQYASEGDDSTLHIIVYSGEDDEYTFYEDEGDNYNCEQGAYSLIKFLWNEEREVLTIGPRQGSFPGMPTERMFKVCVIKPDTVSPVVDVFYKGEELKIEMKQ